jgi:hypothetical protein
MTMADEPQPLPGEPQPLNIELGEDVAEGQYANLAIISHSNAEFILDFIRVLPGLPKARVKSRLIMTPQHTKRLMLALQDNVRKFENNFGEIDLGPMEHGPMGPIGFGSGSHGLA